MSTYQNSNEDEDVKMITYPKQCCHFGVLIASYGDDDEDEDEDDDDDDDGHEDDDDAAYYGGVMTMRVQFVISACDLFGSMFKT